MALSDLADQLAALVAMLVAIRPIVRSAVGGTGRASPKRMIVLAGGAAAALTSVLGLLILRVLVLNEDVFYLPTALGGTLAAFGGMLGVGVLLARRAPDGMSEDQAIHYATLAGAMSVYLAAPMIVLGLLGATRLLRAALPWTVTQARWWRAVEGVALLALMAVPRDDLVGGLRAPTDLLSRF